MNNLQNPVITIHIDDKDKSDTDPSCCVILCASSCVLIFCLPFIVADLYYAYSYGDTCLLQPIPSLPTLGTWLAVNGWVNLVFLVIVFGMTVFFMKANINPNNIASLCAKILTGCFGLAWLIVGAVIFWKYLQPFSSCSSSLSTYMWVRLIMGLVGVFNVCRTEKKD